MSLTVLHRRRFNKLANAFITVWDTTQAGISASDQIELPLPNDFSPHNFEVYYLGQLIKTVTTFNDRLITFPDGPGIKEIKIIGTFGRWAFNNGGDRLKILSINKWGDFGITYPGSFDGCSNLTADTVSDVLVSTLNNWTGIFRRCTSLTKINRINEWDMSTVTNLSSCFFDSGFDDDITAWDMSSMITFTSAFRNCPFNQPIGVWNMINVTNVQAMFQDNIAFNQDISDWDIRNVGNFVSFMSGKDATNYDSGYLSNIYNKWSLLPVKPNLVGVNFGSITYSAGGQTGRDILTNAPNNWSITDGGGLLYNTLLGNASVTVPTANNLAFKLGISAANVTYFNISGTDVQANINTTYNVQEGAFSNNLDITRYDDFEGKMRAILKQGFQTTTAMTYIDFRSVTSIAQDALNNAVVLEIIAPELLNITGNNCLRNASVQKLVANKLTTIGGGILQFRDTAITTFTATSLVNLGANSGDNTIFALGNWSGCTMTIPVFLKTNNGGNPDGDLTEVINDGGIIIYV